MPIEFYGGRNREKDYSGMCQELEQKGWAKIPEFGRIKIFLRWWIDTDPSQGSLYGADTDTQRWLSQSPSHASNTFYPSPCVYVTKEPLSYGLNRIESGGVLAVWEYEE